MCGTGRGSEVMNLKVKGSTRSLCRFMQIHTLGMYSVLPAAPGPTKERISHTMWERKGGLQISQCLVAVFCSHTRKLNKDLRLRFGRNRICYTAA